MSVTFADSPARRAGSTERAKFGYGLGKEEGEAFWVLGMLETIKIGREDTDGEYGLVEVVARAGDGSPWHVHPDEDEWFYGLGGEFTIYVGDARVSLTPGSFAFGPKGMPHTFIAETEGATLLLGFQPFLFEGFMREAGEPAAERVLPPPPESPPDMEQLVPIAASHGFEILGPPGPPPAQ
jgi:quercetin dioxygenase-like cupin family protein